MTNGALNSVMLIFTINVNVPNSPAYWTLGECGTSRVPQYCTEAVSLGRLIPNHRDMLFLQVFNWHLWAPSACQGLCLVPTDSPNPHLLAHRCGAGLSHVYVVSAP